MHVSLVLASRQNAAGWPGWGLRTAGNQRCALSHRRRVQDQSKNPS